MGIFDLLVDTLIGDVLTEVGGRENRGLFVSLEAFGINERD